MNPANRSPFVAGHAHHNAIVGFAIPGDFGADADIVDLPVVTATRRADRIG